MYDSDLGRFGAADPMGGEYANSSLFSYSFNNPIRFFDPDGRTPKDIVYFNRQGQEIYRIKSNTVFKTYVAKQNGITAAAVEILSQYQENPVHHRFFMEASMPGVIQNRAKGGPATTEAAFQEHDYEIAAQTSIFNLEKEKGTLSLVSEGGNIIPSNVVQDIPNLSPTLVKALAMQESSLGVGTNTTDIMQVNNTGDWSSIKSNYGLTQGSTPSISLSIGAGIKILATKGFRNGITYDSNTGKSSYTFQGWSSAVDEYNGKGTQGYKENVLRMFNNAK